MMKRYILFAILMMSIVMGSVAIHAQSDVTLTYIASQGWVFDSEMALGQQFEEQTGIHIDYQIIPSDQYFTLLKTKLNSGEGPDIFGGQSGVSDLVVQYDVENNAVDLSAEPWASHFDPLVAAQATVNGKLYGLTLWATTATTWVVNYNKALFDEHGLSVPTTYNDFKSVCQTLLDAGIQPIFEPFSDGWHHVLWFPELGPRYEQVTPGLADELNANQATFAGDETMLTVLQQFKELYDMGCMGQNALSDAYSDRDSVMATGDAAMILANLTFPQEVEAAYPEVSADSFGQFVMPLADNQVLNINPAGPTKFIYSGSPHVEEAKQYFDFLTQPENLQYMIDNTPAMQTLPFEGLDLLPRLLPNQEAFLDEHSDRGTVFQTAVTYVNPQWIDIGKDLTAMVTDTMQPEDVLVSIDSRRNELARAARDPAWDN
ncbi:MAG: ABC transporter substrate-binding protein [Chloroflexota bacterium]